MLVLSRQRDETIMIGDDIELTVVDIRGDKVRLGIKAPSHVAVHRKEIYDAIKRENEQAARLSGPGGIDQGELGALSSNIPARRTTRRAIPTATKLTDQGPDIKRESA